MMRLHEQEDSDLDHDSDGEGTVVGVGTNCVGWLKILAFVENDLIPWVQQRVADEKSRYNGDVKHKGFLAQQAVYQHFMLGKALFPREAEHELFTVEYYPDESMVELIGKDAYKEFRAKVIGACDRFRDEFEDTVSQVVPLQTVLAMLKTKPQRLVRSAFTRSRMARTGVYGEQRFVELLIKHMCVGAFKDNSHSAGMMDVGTRLPGFTECFSSPFENNATYYHSMFPAHDLNGSGNFFLSLDDVGLLPDGCYQISPPQHNQIMNKVAQIVVDSVESGRDLHLFMMMPDWPDTLWTRRLDSVLQNPRYRANSRSWVQDMKVGCNVGNRGPFTTRLHLWTISTSSRCFTPAVCRYLGLDFRPCPEREPVTVAGKGPELRNWASFDLSSMARALPVQ